MEVGLANVKKGQLTRPPQWWKHLRDWKKIFWRKERKAVQKEVKDRISVFESDRINHSG